MRLVSLFLASTALALASAAEPQQVPSGAPPGKPSDARKLLADPNPQVRLRAALELTAQLDEQAVGVLIEAFVARAYRYWAQVWLSLAGLVVAFVWTLVMGISKADIFGVVLWQHHTPHHVAALGAVGVDGPTLFIQGTILVLALMSLLLIAERRHEPSPFTAQASSVPGTAEERESLVAGILQTEVFPLILFAVGGMLMAKAAGWSLTAGTYLPLLIYAGIAYLLAFAVIHYLVPRMAPAPLGTPELAA